MRGPCVSIKGVTSVGKRRAFFPRDISGCVLWVQHDRGVVMHGTPRASGTTPPAMTVSSAPDNTPLYVQIDGAGARGTATFKVSRDGGSTFTQTGTVTAATNTLSDGTVLNWPVGTYATNNIYKLLVATWKDQSGAGNDLSAGAAPWVYNPAGINGKTAMQLTGLTNGNMSSPSMTLGLFTVALVMNMTGGAGYVWVHNSNAANGAYMYGSTGNSNSIIRGVNTSGYDISSNWSVDGVTRAVGVRFGGTGQHSDHLIYYGGTQQSPSNAGTVQHPGTGTVSGSWFFGTTQTGTVPSTGHIAAIFAYNRGLGATDMRKLGVLCNNLYGSAQ